jgi:hypothetical protein
MSASSCPQALSSVVALPTCENFLIQSRGLFSATLATMNLLVDLITAELVSEKTAGFQA